ncbi:inositol monophosphatase family protein [Aminobacter sp. BA135]|uniref:inositol monophosphatase family protein n=1 Tax=Aminobacter sp. BA135 TaxID=537596 RepID=UPI003D78D919
MPHQFLGHLRPRRREPDMTASTDTFIAQVAEAAAREAGALIRTSFLEAARGAVLGVEEKHGYADIVTITDKQSERLIWRVIRAHVPDSRILGEESGWQGEGEVVWYVDPIDGTSNFASGLPFFCVSIAAFGADGTPIVGVVYDPMQDEMFTTHSGQLLLNGVAVTPAVRARSDRDAELLTNLPREGSRPTAVELERFGDLVMNFRAVRRLGSAALQLAYVAIGRAAINYDEGCHPWDIAAGLQLVAASGGQLLCWSKEDNHLIADPLARLETVNKFVVTTPEYDLRNSAVLTGWASVS